MQEYNTQFRALGNIVNITTYLSNSSKADKFFLLLEKELLRIQIKFYKV